MHIERDATLEQVLEFVVHRSAYQLKEADPHSFALPRLWGPPKAAELVEANGAVRQRAAAGEGGDARTATAWLVDAYAGRP